MNDRKRATYERLVQASLLIEEAGQEASRAANVAANARQPIARIAESVLELHELASALNEICSSADALYPRVAARLGNASRVAGRLAGTLLTEVNRAQAGLDKMHLSVRRSSECTQEASSLIKVA